MKNEFPDITPQQLKTFESLERIKMGWVAFYATLVLTVLGFLFLVVLVFFKPSESWAAKVAVCFVEGTFGFAFKHVIGYLFQKVPDPDRAIEGAPKTPELPANPAPPRSSPQSSTDGPSDPTP